MDCSLPGSSVHGIFQARILEWVAISFSRRSSWPRDWTWVSHIVGRCFTVWATREVGAIKLGILVRVSFTVSSHPCWLWRENVSCSVVANSLQTPWTVACQAPLSMKFSRQEYCSGLLFPSPGNLPNPGIEPWSPASQAGFFSHSLKWKTTLWFLKWQRRVSESLCHLTSLEIHLILLSS